MTTDEIDAIVSAALGACRISTLIEMVSQAAPDQRIEQALDCIETLVDCLADQLRAIARRGKGR